MDYFEIEGKNQLFGDVDISGAKNAVLPLGCINSKQQPTNYFKCSEPF